jgi:hypothetical protein
MPKEHEGGFKKVPNIFPIKHITDTKFPKLGKELFPKMARKRFG